MDAQRASKYPIGDTDRASAIEQFKSVGQSGYKQGSSRYNEEHSGEDVTIKTTRTELLRVAGLSRKAENNRKVSAALNRLRRPVGKFPPLILYCRIGMETLTCDVASEWIPAKGCRQVSLPLLTSGATALALYLFLSAIDPSKKMSAKADKLYRLLGIRASRPSHAIRMLRQSLKLVNDYRRDLGLDTFEIVKHGERLSFRAAETETVQDSDEHEGRLDDGEIDDLDQRVANPTADEVRQEQSYGDAGGNDGMALNDDYAHLDDDEIENHLRRQEADEKYYRQREARDQERAMFVGFNERRKATRW